MAIAFLTTRVKKTDKEDCKKLRRLSGYLKQSIKLPLILRADGVTVLKWLVDASYAAHDNMQRHTVVTMSIGKDGSGSIISTSKKQKLNTKSSTKSETHWGGQRDTIDAMDNLLPGSPRIWNRR